MKGRILNILKAESGIVSGEKISSLLGISRVSIWKHIHKLLEAGYDIRSTPTGYQFVSSPDALYPWEFPEREKYIHHYAEASSTMDIARDLARKGCPSFTVVIAGIIAMDSYFAYSAFFAFMRISQIYDAKKEENGFGFLDIVRIYARRLVRILPLFYLTFLAGIFLGPRISSGGVWFMYE
jgi:biotin operon repressor BirA-like protein